MSASVALFARNIYIGKKKIKIVVIRVMSGNDSHKKGLSL